MHIKQLVELIRQAQGLAPTGKNRHSAGEVTKALDDLFAVVQAKMEREGLTRQRGTGNEKSADVRLESPDSTKLSQLDRKGLQEVLIAIDAGRDKEILRAAGRLKTKIEALAPCQAVREDGQDHADPKSSKNTAAHRWMLAVIALAAVIVTVLILTGGKLPWRGAGDGQGLVAPPSGTSSAPASTTSQQAPPSAQKPTTSVSRPTASTPAPTAVPQRKAVFDKGQTYHVSTPVNGSCLGFRAGYPLTIQTFCEGSEMLRVRFPDDDRILDASDQKYCLAPTDVRTVSANLATTRTVCGDPAAAQGQLWDIEPLPGGLYQIRSRLNAEMCLTAKSDGPSESGKPAPRFYECAQPDLKALQSWSIAKIP